TTMTTKQGKKTLHKTILTNSDVEINKAIDDDMFTVRVIEKGL
ncbi:MAG: outer membrane lipoprotein-sorting protein, partial [Candidatus Thioglobus sp.]|nr:outer membrane lipoprotein-sorting protein [Candidatus Thioglobus sp.]